MALYTAESDVVAFGLDVIRPLNYLNVKKRKIAGILDTCV